MLPDNPDGSPSEVQNVKPRLDFHVKKPLAVNITDKHVSMLWKLIGGKAFFSQYGKNNEGM